MKTLDVSQKVTRIKHITYIASLIIWKNEVMLNCQIFFIQFLSVKVEQGSTLWNPLLEAVKVYHMDWWNMFI